LYLDCLVHAFLHEGVTMHHNGMYSIKVLTLSIALTMLTMQSSGSTSVQMWRNQ